MENTGRCANRWEPLYRMPLIDRINLITVFLIGVFMLPIAVGMLRPLTYERIHASVSTVISVALAVVSGAGAVWFTERLYSNGGDNPLGRLFKGVPAVWYSIVSQDVLIYFMIVLILMLGLNGGLQMLLIPLNRKVLVPLSLKLGSVVAAMNRAVARIVSGLWQLPKAVWLVLVFALLFNFYTLLTSNDALNSYIRSSSAFRLIDRAAVQPIISSGAVRQIPEFIDSTVDKAVQCLSPEGRKMLIKVYINGVTVEDAVASSPEIDNIAIDLVDAENDRYLMAERLYRWVCVNITYDHAKAESLKTDAFAMPSGAVAAFSGMTGVCFDKACLYVAMCRAVGVRVRLITGEGFNGREWIDHSWNQIYSDRDRRWVNVDPTFGTNDKSYFNCPDFDRDHRDGEIQGEW